MLSIMMHMKHGRKLFDDPELDKLVKEIRRRHIVDKVNYKKL